MKWEDILFEYEEALAFIKRQKEYHSQDYIDGMYNMLRSNIRRAKLYCEDFPIADQKNTTFIYRHNSYEIKFDDYGQQLYIEVDGQTLPGGAYNSNPEMDWSEMLDYIIDEKFFQSNQKYIDKT